MSQASKLEEIAKNKREELLTKNSFNKSGEGKKYNVNHSKALSDDKTPDHGKGTGKFLDTYNGGNDFDVNGNPNKSGSGRAQNLGFNKYSQENGYSHPDTSGNDDQTSV